MENKLKEYLSPRISWEILDCSMPLTFDQYNWCGYNCLYCFSQYQKGIGCAKKSYKKKLNIVNVERIKKIFNLEKEVSYSDYIQKKYTLQWGGLSDPFCPFEEKYGIGLELMKFFNEIEYPISFSSKSDLILRDERYFNEFKKAGDRWHFKASIITFDEEKAKKIEQGVPSPKRRFEVLKKLREIGTHTTLRMRPIIVGLTTNDFEELIKTAKENNVETVSAEFFCYDVRSTGVEATWKNYQKLNEILGYDVGKFYKQFKGDWTGYIRLSREIKLFFVNKLEAICKKYDIPIVWSDSSFKDRGFNGSCCGIKSEWEKLKFCKLQYTNFCKICRQKGFLTLNEALEIGKDEIFWRDKTLLDGNRNLKTQERKIKRKMSFLDFFINSWNNLKGTGNPIKNYDYVLKNAGKDGQGNRVYMYNFERDKKWKKRK